MQVKDGMTVCARSSAWTGASTTSLIRQLSCTFSVRWQPNRTVETPKNKALTQWLVFVALFAFTLRTISELHKKLSTVSRPTALSKSHPKCSFMLLDTPLMHSVPLIGDVRPAEELHALWPAPLKSHSHNGPWLYRSGVLFWPQVSKVTAWQRRTLLSSLLSL